MNNSLRWMLIISMSVVALFGSTIADAKAKKTVAATTATCENPNYACTGTAPLGGSYCLRGNLHIRGLDNASTLWAMNESVMLDPTVEASSCKAKTIFSTGDNLFVRINQAGQTKIALFLKLANKLLQGDLKKCALSTEKDILCLRIDDTDLDYYVLLLDKNVGASPMNKWYRVEAFPHAGTPTDAPACQAERPDAVPGIGGAKDNWTPVNAAGKCAGDGAAAPNEVHQGQGGEPYP